MRGSICLLVFFPYLHWLAYGAAVLTSPSSAIPIFQPHGLNGSNAFPSGLSVVAEARGHQLQTSRVFDLGLRVTSLYLAPEDFYGIMPSQSWFYGDLILAVIEDVRMFDQLQRRFVIFGIYFSLLLMKNTNDFRSARFEILDGGDPVCDILIYPSQNSGLKIEPKFAYVTQLALPPSPIANSTDSSSKLVESALGERELLMNYTVIEPLRPLDLLGVLISDMHMLVTAAQPPKDERIQRHTDSVVPLSGVRTSISPVIDVRPPDVFAYRHLIKAALTISDIVRTQSRPTSAFRVQLHLHGVYIGEITMVPSNSSAPRVR